MRFAVRLTVAGLVLVLSGCTYTTTGTAPGTLAIQAPGTMPAPPPPPPAAQAPPAVATLPPEGAYAGFGHVRTNPGGGCDRRVTVRNFVVTGSDVRYGGFRGTIQPDLTVAMQAGRRHITGRFEGDRFVGLFWRPQPACTYNLVLHHTGES